MMIVPPDYPLDMQFAYYAECQIATLGRMKDRKSTGKHEMELQQAIVDGMLAVCRRHGIQPHRYTPRLRKLLWTDDTENTNPESDPS